MESIEKLRAAGRNMAKGRNLENHEECNLLLVIADEIEAEISEKFVELPCDAEGVPIRCDDVMEGVTRWEGERFKVYCMEIYPDGHWEVTDDDTCDSIRATECRHYKPRTVEDVLQDAGVSVAAIEDVAAEIRELMGVDA